MNQVEFAGKAVYYSLSPCSWMYPGYGCQVQLSMVAAPVNAGSVFALEKEFAGKDRAELEAVAESVALRWLHKHGVAPIEEAQRKWETAAAEFAAEEAKHVERAAKRQAAALAKLKAQGFAFILNGWVHPNSGDDRPVSIAYKTRPGDADIKRALRGCTVKTDYVVTPL